MLPPSGHTGRFLLPPRAPAPGPPLGSSFLAPGLRACSCSCLLCSLLLTPSPPQVSAQTSPPPGSVPASLDEDRALDVFLVCRCCNKLGGLTTEMCSLTVLGPEVQSQGVDRGWFPPGALTSSAPCVCQLPGASGNQWHSLGFDRISTTSASILSSPFPLRD